MSVIQKLPVSPHLDRVERRRTEALNDLIDASGFPKTLNEKNNDTIPSFTKYIADVFYDPRRLMTEAQAAGDGSTDCSDAFNNAIALAYDQGANHTEADQIGIDIIVPPGIWLLSSAIDVNVDGVRLWGYGRQSVLKTDGDFAAIDVDHDTLQKLYGFEAHNIRFTSTVTDRGAGSAGIKMTDCEEWLINNCYFHLITQYGVHFVNCISGVIQNSLFHSGDWNNNGMGYGIYGEVSDTNTATGGNNVRVIGNQFQRTVTAGVAILGEPESGATTPSRKEAAGVAISYNRFEHNYGDDIQIDRFRGVISNNWHEDGGLTAASGNAYIHDLATDDDEGTGGGEISGNNRVHIHDEVFGGHDNSHNDFQFVQLNYSVGSKIYNNYLTVGKDSVGAGIFGITADNSGLSIFGNWASSAEPTLSGTLPTYCEIYDNWKGPTSGAGRNQWTGNFHEYRGNQTPQTITGTSDTTPSILDANTGKIKTFILAPTGALTITMFDDADNGDVLCLVFANGNTTIQNTSGNNGINLVGGANFVGTTKDIMVLKYIDGAGSGYTNRWFEVSQALI